MSYLCLSSYPTYTGCSYEYSIVAGEYSYWYGSLGAANFKSNHDPRHYQLIVKNLLLLILIGKAKLSPSLIVYPRASEVADSAPCASNGSCAHEPRVTAALGGAAWELLSRRTQLPTVW